jgi:outer membrane lipoprotein-sorting protein
MKKLLFALLSFAFLSASAQTADEVIQKYTAGIGGLDAYNKVKTAKMTGTFSTQGMDLPVTVQIVNGKAVRMEVEAMGNQVINVYNNGKGWKQNPFAGAADPTDATADELNELKPQSMLAPPLADYKARGHKVELLGQADVNGVKTYKIKLTNKEDGKPTTYYINASDYSLLKYENDRDMQGQTITVESWVSDLKDFNGAKFYLTRVQKINGEEFSTTKFDKIELDVPVDEKIFNKP